MKKNPKRYLVGITGASGAIYAVRLIESLLNSPHHEVHLMISSAGQRVLTGELDEPKPGKKRAKGAGGGIGKLPLQGRLNLSADQYARLIAHPVGDIGCGPASGTFRTEAMVIVPCSMNTLAAVAHGIANNLVTRSAAVTLKEGRPLILVPRETPLTLIDLRNMTAIAEAGGVILPANPGFYHRPKEIEDLVGYVVQKIMDRLGLRSEGGIRWGEESESL